MRPGGETTPADSTKKTSRHPATHTIRNKTHPCYGMVEQLDKGCSSGCSSMSTTIKGSITRYALLAQGIAHCHRIPNKRALYCKKRQSHALSYQPLARLNGGSAPSSSFVITVPSSGCQASSEMLFPQRVRTASTTCTSKSSLKRFIFTKLSTFFTSANNYRPC